MRAITKSRTAVRQALSNEGWRVTVTASMDELNRHRDTCTGLSLPAGSETDCRTRTIREQLLRGIPWELRGQPASRWLSYISRDARRQLQRHLPIAAQFCLAHGFVYLVGDVWAERVSGRWRIHRADGPAVICDDRELYYWRGWHVSKECVMGQPSVSAILAEDNQTHREVLLQRMGIENFTREAELETVDTFRDCALLKVNTATMRGTWRNGDWVERSLPIAFLKVICPSTQKTYFLRCNPDIDSAKHALEATLPGYTRDWEKDLVAET